MESGARPDGIRRAEQTAGWQAKPPSTGPPDSSPGSARGVWVGGQRSGSVTVARQLLCRSLGGGFVVDAERAARRSGDRVF